MQYSRRPYQPFSQRRQARKDRKKLIFSLIGAVILLYLLFIVILPTLIGGLSFFNKFKPKITSQTQASVTDTTLAPPVLDIPYEATNTAQIKVSGYALPDVKIEIYLDDNLVTTTKTSSDGSFTTDDIHLALGSNSITGKTVDSHNNKSLSSKNIQIIYNNQNPKLTVDQPQDDSSVSDTKVIVSGSVDQSDPASVEVNGLRLILTSDGRFSQSVNLNPGDNELTITATDNAGNTTTMMRKVTSTASPTPTPKP